MCPFTFFVLALKSGWEEIGGSSGIRPLTTQARITPRDLCIYIMTLLPSQLCLRHPSAVETSARASLDYHGAPQIESLMKGRAVKSVSFEKWREVVAFHVRASVIFKVEICVLWVEDFGLMST